MSSLDLWPIGNCQVSALVDGAAGFVWACQPRVDGDPLFCSLLEPKRRGRPRGEWRIALENQVSAEQRYLKNTPILVTRLTDADGARRRGLRFLPALRAVGADVPAGRLRPHRPAGRGRAAAPGRRSTRRATGARATPSGPAAPTISAFWSSRSRCGSPPTRRSSTCSTAAASGSRRRCISSSGPDEPFVGNVGQTLATMLHQTADHWRDWVRGLAIPLEWQRDRDPRRDHAQAVPARGDRRDRRRADHLDPRGAPIRAATGTIATAGSATLITPCRR